MRPRLLQAPPFQTSVLWWLQSSGGSSERLLIRLPKGCSPRCRLPAKALGQLFGCSSAFFPPLPCLSAPLGVIHRSRRPRAPSYTAASSSCSCSRFSPPGSALWGGTAGFRFSSPANCAPFSVNRCLPI